MGWSAIVCRRAGVGAGGQWIKIARRPVSYVMDQQPASDHPCAKNHQGGQNDFPRIHCAWSLWSTDASNVLSKFWERSSALFGAAGLKSTHAPSSKAIAAHDTAARQSPRIHNPR